jgi:hypothetical protein
MQKVSPGRLSHALAANADRAVGYHAISVFNMLDVQPKGVNYRVNAAILGSATIRTRRASAPVRCS